MKMRIHSPAALIIISLFGLLLVHRANLSQAQQCQIVRIAKEMRVDQNKLYLYPSELTVNSGTCVIWINAEPHEKVSINFDEHSNACILASDAPSGFMVLEGCFLTDFLDYGQTVSLRFKDPGVFTYQLEIQEKQLVNDLEKTRKIVRKGKIIVE